jgi:hypothetical protein
MRPLGSRVDGDGVGVISEFFECLLRIDQRSRFVIGEVKAKKRADAVRRLNRSGLTIWLFLEHLDELINICRRKHFVGRTHNLFSSLRC